MMAACCRRLWMFCIFLVSSSAVLGQTPAKSPQPTELSPKEFDVHWAILAQDDAAKAYRSIWTMVAAAKQSIPLMKDRLRPAAPLDARQVAQWVTDLDNSRFADRKKASEALEKLGELAEPALKKALEKKPSLEVRQRLEALLKKLEGPVTSPESLRLIRAVEVLELASTAEARELLASLGKGAPEARLTRDARESLERLNKRPPAKP
jgi:hypothetical protein